MFRFPPPSLCLRILNDSHAIRALRVHSIAGRCCTLHNFSKRGERKTAENRLRRGREDVRIDFSKWYIDLFENT
jgi:hypothetical protein